MGTSTGLSYLDVSDSEGSIAMKAGKATVSDLLHPASALLLASGAGRIRIITTEETPPMAIMGDAILAALTTRRKSFSAKTPDWLLFHLATGSAVPTSTFNLADSLGLLIEEPHAGDVLIDFSEINEPHLKSFEKVFKDIYGARSKNSAPSHPTRRAESLQRNLAPAAGLADAELLASLDDPLVLDEASSELVQLEQAAAARRAELADDWPTAAQVSRAMGSTAGNASHLATKLRRAGALLGVYLPVPGGSWRFPRWQFRPDGQPVEYLKDILHVLHNDGPFLDTQRRTTGWGEVEWFISRHVLLDDKTPAEVLATDPKRVLEAARTEFGGDA